MDIDPDQVPGSPLLEEAVNVLQEIVFVCAADGTLVEWNRRLNEKSGYADTEIAGMHATEFVPPEDAELVRDKIDEVLREGQTQVEVRLRTKSGELIPHEVTCSLLEREGKRLLYGAGRDISRRTRAEPQRVSTEERFRRLFENVPVGVAITSPEGEILEANPTATEIFGYSPEEIPDLNVADLYADPADRILLTGELEEEGVLSGKEVRFLRADGTEIICEISAAASYADDGTIRTYEISFQDVTDRKRTQTALRESEEKFRRLAEGAEIGIALIQDGVYQYVNPAAAKITGYPPERMIGTSPEEYVRASDWPHIREQIQKRLEEPPQEVRYETPIVTASGETRYVTVSGSRITYQGRPATLATILDVTEERRLEREILLVQEEERKSLGRELHDNLAGTLMGASMLLGRLEEQVDENASAYSSQIERVRNLIQNAAANVRDLSHGLAPAGLSDGNLLLALDALAEDAENIRFEAEGFRDASGDLPLGEEESTHLYRIAQEAANNARRHGEASKIIVRLERRSSGLVLKIVDDGRGFRPQNLEATGRLGLRSMQHRADVLNAEFQIESAPGEGTRISCHYPL